VLKVPVCGGFRRFSGLDVSRWCLDRIDLDVEMFIATVGPEDCVAAAARRR